MGGVARYRWLVGEGDVEQSLDALADRADTPETRHGTILKDAHHAIVTSASQAKEPRWIQ